MSTLTPDLLKDVALTVDLGERLTLIIVFGPGYLADDGLAEIRLAIGAGRRVLQHRLDRLGPNIAETIASAEGARPIVLVSGLERMAGGRREQVQARMNLVRDTLNQHPAVVVMWIPVEIADEFRRLCIDLFQWRTLTVYVEGPEHDEGRIRHEYLVALATAELTSATASFELRVQVEGEDEPRGVEAWLASVRRGLLLGSAGSGKTTALRRYAARRADASLDGVSVELPVFVAARLLPQGRIDWATLTRAVVPSLDDETGLWLAQQLASAPAILFIDGLDELPRAQRGRFDVRFSMLVDGNPRLRVVLAARDASQVVGDWQRAQVLPLEPAEVAAWLRNIGYDPVDSMDAIASVGAEDLTANPLSLEIVATLASHQNQPWELDSTEWMGHIVDSRLGHWDMGKGVEHRAPGSSAHARTELAHLAAQLVQSQRETEWRPGGDALLDFVAERSGIIRAEDSPGTNYGFTDQVFRDYFAGCWLAGGDPSPDQLASAAADPAWRRPTHYALDLLGPRERESATEKIWEASADEPPPTRWAMRTLVLRTTLGARDRSVRSQFIERAKHALQQAQRDAESPAEWAPVAELLERVDEGDG